MKGFDVTFTIEIFIRGGEEPGDKGDSQFVQIGYSQTCILRAGAEMGIVADRECGELCVEGIGGR